MDISVDRPPDNRKTFAQRVHWLGLSFAARDQPALVMLLLTCLCGMGWYFWRQSIELNGLIDVDQLQPQTAVFQVDINAAPWSEMVNLPGIGQRLAVEIADYRETHGPFETLESLQDVHGIGVGKFRKIRPHLLPLLPLDVSRSPTSGTDAALLGQTH